MEPYSTCFRCKYEEAGQLKYCPKCGARMRSSATLRKTGWFLVWLSVPILIGLVLLPFWMMANWTAESTEKLQSEWLDAILAFCIYGLMIAIFWVFAVGGVYQIRFGRRNKNHLAAMWRLIGALGAVGRIVRD